MLLELERSLNNLQHNVYPSLNAWTTENEAILTAEIPGVDPEKIEITMVGDTLTLRGEREPESPSDADSWLLRERESGNFTRSIQLPFQVDGERVTAKARHGVLTVTLPYAESEKPRRIAVKAE